VKRAVYVLSGRLPSAIKRLIVRFASATFLVGVLGIVLAEQEQFVRERRSQFAV
jgi:hypothetical protein